MSERRSAAPYRREQPPGARASRGRLPPRTITRGDWRGAGLRRAALSLGGIRSGAGSWSWQRILCEAARALASGDCSSARATARHEDASVESHRKHQRVPSDCGRCVLRPEDWWLAETTLGASRRGADRFSMQRCGQPRPATNRRLHQTRGGSVWPFSRARRRAARRVRRSGLRVRGRSRGGTCSRSRRSPRPFPSRPLGRGRRRHARRRP
jgi:hypothetical protein